MSAKKCNRSITATLLSVSLISPTMEIPLYDNNTFSQEDILTTAELMPDSCAHMPVPPCHDDEEVELHTSYEIFEPRFEDKPLRKKKSISREA